MSKRAKKKLITKTASQLGKKEETSYREELPHGHGIDLEPKSGLEIKAAKSKNNSANEADWEATLNGGKNSQYFKENGHLGSLPLHDDYSEEGEV